MEIMNSKEIQVRGHYRHRQDRACVGCPVKSLVSGLLLLWCLFICGQSVQAQEEEIRFQSGEELSYTMKYKYGLIVMTGATGVHRLSTTTYNGKSSFKASVTLKTTTFFDKVYRTRDTLFSYISIPALHPLYAERMVHEDKTHFSETVKTLKFTNTQSQVDLKRTREGRAPLDTIMTTNAIGYDMLSMLLFVRSLDYDTMDVGTTKNIVIFFGPDQANITIRYNGKQTVDVGKYRYNAIKLNLDIMDDAFTTSKDAIEMWLGDDQNRVPVRIKAKLKFGAAEGELSNTKNLKYPFSSQTKK
ncbi:MAG: DUF3108 domain-containing protein [Candidatus Symbiothrix sp.]|nr:DUF3108 domain-containing protein [Candidatus Symbiothrix sp.]